MNAIDFPFADTIAGYVTDFDRESDGFEIRTSGGKKFDVRLKGNTYARLIRNLGEPYADCTSQMREMLDPGCFLFVYGIYYPEGGGYTFEAEFIVFAGRKVDEFVFERQDWWIRQIQQLGDFFLQAQFQGKEVDYEDYRTTITLTGEKPKDHYRQETDTISRLVYGFASAYLLTGQDRFLDAAEKGTEYLREHMRFCDLDENIVYWYHGIDVHGSREDKVFASEFGDDFDAIPAYEQIYALAGPIQTYRITGDPRILHDAELTVDLFDRFYLDKTAGGYFSHLDPITLDPRSDALGANKGKKNWNSVGDHAPAYLFNLWLATGENRYASMLEHTFDTIARHFPDYQNSPFVQEKFYEDWSHDIHSHVAAEPRRHRAQPENRLEPDAHVRPASPRKSTSIWRARSPIRCPRWAPTCSAAVGMTLWNVCRKPGQEWHRFAFHNRKAWWQQEQGILAYLILHGILDDEKFLAHRPRFVGVLQRLLPRSRRRRCLFQRSCKRHSLSDGYRTVQGQPFDERLPFVRAVLPGAGLHQLADHAETARPILQSDAGRFQAQNPSRGP